MLFSYFVLLIFVALSIIIPSETINTITFWLLCLSVFVSSFESAIKEK